MFALTRLHNRSSFRLEALGLAGYTTAHELHCWRFLYSFDSLSYLSLRHGGAAFSNSTIIRFIPRGFGQNTGCLLSALTQFHYAGDIRFDSRTLTTMLGERYTASQIDDSIKPILSFNITYRNARWARTGDHANPNRVQVFHREIAKLACRGIVLKVLWDEGTVV